jgi:hypothetical protein
MLDVHPPHEAAHTWKDFFIHIATIVIGLLIAVGLEQMVEHFHHREQARQLEESLNQEIDKNLTILRNDTALMEQIRQVEERNKASLESTRASHGKIDFDYIDFDPTPEWFPPTNAVWAAARDNGTLSLLPPARASYLSQIDFSNTTTIEISHQVFDARYRVLALVHLHPSLPQLSPAEQDALLLAISTYEETADHARSVMAKGQITLHRNDH